MNNIVLYRKYRPKSFAEITGQEHIVQTLTNALKSGSISHAYLFAGPRGTGKTSFARLLAKAVNCKNRKQEEYEPCNQCNSCEEINQGNAIDLIEIDAASNRGIDEIRELKEGIGFVPVKSKYKVFIIDESHQLTKEAANALLKTLEEPPSHAIFVLATTEAHKMLPTIVSRCQRFDFRKLQVKEITGRLAKILSEENIDSEPEALNLIAGLANGSMRDAETMLDQAVSFCGQDKKIEQREIEELLGIVNKEAIFKLLNFIAEKKTKEAIEFLNKAVFQGTDVQELVKSLLRYLRELLFLQIDPGLENPLVASTVEDRKKLTDLANRFSESELKEILKKFTEAEQKIKYASIPQLPLELVIVESCMKNQ